MDQKLANNLLQRMSRFVEPASKSLAEASLIPSHAEAPLVDKSAAGKVRGEDISLKRKHGPPLKVRVSPRKREEEKQKKEESKNVNHEAMNALKVTLNLSENKTLKAKRILSLSLGSKKIQPKYREKNIEKNRILVQNIPPRPEEFVQIHVFVK